MLQKRGSDLHDCVPDDVADPIMNLDARLLLEQIPW
jgi:hypothetical protein